LGASVTAYWAVYSNVFGKVLIIPGFDNPILTVTWLGFFHINATSG